MNKKQNLYRSVEHKNKQINISIVLNYYIKKIIKNAGRCNNIQNEGCGTQAGIGGQTGRNSKR